MMTDTEDRFIDLFIISCVIAVIVLKLTGVIQISWLLLTAVLWVPFLGGLVLAVGILLIFLLENLFKNIKEKE